MFRFPSFQPLDAHQGARRVYAQHYTIPDQSSANAAAWLALANQRWPNNLSQLSKTGLIEVAAWWARQWCDENLKRQNQPTTASGAALPSDAATYVDSAFAMEARLLGTSTQPDDDLIDAWKSIRWFTMPWYSLAQKSLHNFLASIGNPNGAWIKFNADADANNLPHAWQQILNLVNSYYNATGAKSEPVYTLVVPPDTRASNYMNDQNEGKPLLKAFLGITLKQDDLLGWDMLGFMTSPVILRETPWETIPWSATYQGTDGQKHSIFEAEDGTPATDPNVVMRNLRMAVPCQGMRNVQTGECKKIIATPANPSKPSDGSLGLGSLGGGLFNPFPILNIPGLGGQGQGGTDATPEVSQAQKDCEADGGVFQVDTGTCLKLGQQPPPVDDTKLAALACQKQGGTYDFAAKTCHFPSDTSTGGGDTGGGDTGGGDTGGGDTSTGTEPDEDSPEEKKSSGLGIVLGLTAAAGLIALIVHEANKKPEVSPPPPGQREAR